MEFLWQHKAKRPIPLIMDRNNKLFDQALLCLEQIKNDINNKGEYHRFCDSTFISIDSDSNILMSETPEFLKESDAYQCLMIHRREEKAVTNWYSWYTIQFIDANGCVHTNELDEKFKLYVNYNGCFRNQWLHLSVEGKSIFSCPWPNKDKISIIWTLYNKCKTVASESEAQLLGELAMMDQTILSLKGDLANAEYLNLLLTKERDLYKSLLEEIKSLVQSR